MQFGLGLPNQVPGISRDQMAQFVQRAEHLGFDSIWTLDRLVYGGLSPLPLLSWVAGQTTRVRIGTSILLLPLRRPLVLAKDLATLDLLSGGRLDVGLGAGTREDDFRAAGISMERRDLRMSEGVALLRQAWSGQPVSFGGKLYDVDVGSIGPNPAQAGGPPLWLGGSNSRAMQRAAKLGDGYIAGGGGPGAAHNLIPAVRQAVNEAGRDPNSFPCASLLYCNMAPTAEEGERGVADFLQAYYGRVITDPKTGAACGTPRDVAARIREYADLDLHTLILVATSKEPEQVDRLKEAIALVASGGA